MAIGSAAAYMMVPGPKDIDRNNQNHNENNLQVNEDDISLNNRKIVLNFGEKDEENEQDNFR